MNISSVPTNTGVNTPIQPQPQSQPTRPSNENTTGQTPNGPGAVAGYANSGAGTTLGVKGTDSTIKSTDAATNVQDPKKVTGTGKEQNKDQVKKEDVEQAVSSVNDYINKLRHRELQFSLDDESGKMVIKIMDTDSKKVIQQIPPQEMLRLADNIGKDRGWLVEQKA